ncbi:MAG: polysaccharide biosynthesis C-terminal domain-containing protein, partial [Odoribacter splanchnicus]
LLPRLGYAGAAWAHLGSEWIMVIVSYILSRIYYPVPYPLKRILFYLSGGILFYFLGAWQKDISWTGNILFNLSLIVIYTGVVVKVEKINISRHPF